MHIIISAESGGVRFSSQVKIHKYMSRLTGLIAADQGKEIALVVPDIPKRKKNDCKKIERNEGRTYPKNYAHIMLYVQKHMNKITRLFVEDE